MDDEYIKKMDITQRVLAITGDWKDGPEFWIPIDPVLSNIASLHAEDVAPVRHGRWEEVQFRTIPYNRIGKAKKCSECGKKKDKYVTWNYCPNCGAKMDE